MISCGKSPFLSEESPEISTKKMNSGFDISEDLEVYLTRERQENNTSAGESSILRKISFMGYWQVGPNTRDENKLLIIMQDQEGFRAEIAHEFSAFLWMPDMGHGSAPIKVVKLADGIYELTSLYFIMGGLWEIHFQFKNGEKLINEVLWPINL